MSGDDTVISGEQGGERTRCKFSRYLAPGRFCCGCSLEYGILLIGAAFLVLGTICGILVIRFLAYYDYYSPKQTSAVEWEKQKIKDGMLIAFGVTGIFVFGVITDIILIIGVLKVVASMVGMWCVAILLRGVAELVLAVVMPVRCFAGGLFCQGMEILAVFWAVQIALKFYSSYLAFSLTYYIVRERREANMGLPPRARGSTRDRTSRRASRDASPPYERPATPEQK